MNTEAKAAELTPVERLNRLKKELDCTWEVFAAVLDVGASTIRSYRNGFCAVPSNIDFMMRAIEHRLGLPVHASGVVLISTDVCNPQVLGEALAQDALAYADVLIKRRDAKRAISDKERRQRKGKQALKAETDAGRIALQDFQWELRNRGCSFAAWCRRFGFYPAQARRAILRPGLDTPAARRVRDCVDNTYATLNEEVQP